MSYPSRIFNPARLAAHNLVCENPSALILEG
jgi:hypothetical protein